MLQEHVGKLLGLFVNPPAALAVAVSGGSDSMALLLLADVWTKQNGVALTALTIDHRLRIESANEAKQVASWCAARGITHHTLTWEGEKPESGRQEAARNVRYELLANWCKTSATQYLLTAHHLEDQGETLFFRLARGSGIKGLACMPVASQVYGITLIRPLLRSTKQELQEYLKQHNQTWLEDPTNQRMDYTRNIIRKNLAGTNLAKRAGHIANALGKYRNLLENKLASYLTNIVFVSPAGYASFAADAFKDLTEMIACDALETIILHVSGSTEPLRGHAVEALRLAMRNPQTFKRTALGGCLVGYQPKHGNFIISREPKAMQPAKLLNGQPCMWDNRFEANCDGFTIRALGADGLAQMGRKTLPEPFKDLPAHVLHTIPAFWQLEELACVPHIGYTKPQYAHLRCFATFKPAKALAASAFYGMTNNRNF